MWLNNKKNDSSGLTLAGKKNAKCLSKIICKQKMKRAKLSYAIFQSKGKPEV